MNGDISRRMFLRRFGDNVRDRVPAFENLPSSEAPPTDETPPPEWISVGALALFPPRTELVVTRDGMKEAVLVTSMPEGLQAFTQAGRPLPLEIRRGEVFVHLAGEWPDGHVLSIMTGERVSLAKERESEDE